MKNSLLKKITGTFGLRVSLAGLSLVTALLLARLLGVKEYGSYVYATSLVFLLQIISGLGLREILTRETAIYHSQNKLHLIRGIIKWASTSGLISSLTIGFISTAIAIWSFSQSESGNFTVYVFLIGLSALPFYVLTSIRQGVMQGLGRVVIGEMPETIIQPGLFLLLTLTMVFFSPEILNARSVMLLKVISVALAFFSGEILLRNNLPLSFKKIAPSYETQSWIKSILPFLLISCTYLINSRTDALMLGAMKGEEAVGIYFVACRGASLIVFVLIAVNISLKSRMSELYSQGNLAKIQSILTKSTFSTIVAALPIVMIMFLFGDWLLLLFGSEFAQGHQVLNILCCGQLINAATGSVGTLLSMTGHERYTASSIGISAILNLILNTLLIPSMGIIGAAIATTSSMIAGNIILSVYVYKKLKIYPSILGYFFCSI